MFIKTQRTFWRQFFILLVALTVSGVEIADAQSKFFATSSRGGAEGGKSNAQIGTLQGENDRMNFCTANGMIYAPTHGSADGTTGCVATFTFTDTTTFDNGATVNNGLAVPSGNVDVTNRLTAAEIYVGSGNVGNIPTCTGANKIQWDGTAWACVADEIGATAATETDPKIGSLSNGRWCRTSGTQVICDVNVPSACGSSQKLQWDGSSWSCVADQGLTSESDPQVGSLTSGKWCTTDGGTINCTSDAPSGTTTTTTSGGGGCYGECACLGWCSGGDDNGDW
jgi:hypothetical protein